MSLLKLKLNFLSLITNDIRNPSTSLTILLGRWRDRLRMRSAAVRFEGTSNSSFTGSWTHIKVYQIKLASWRNSKRRTRTIYNRWGPIQKKVRLTLNSPINNRKKMRWPVPLFQSFHPLFLPSSSVLCLSRRLQLEWPYARVYVHPNHLRKYTQILTPGHGTRRVVGGRRWGCWIWNSSLGFRSVKDNIRINLHWVDRPKLVLQENIIFVNTKSSQNAYGM